MARRYAKRASASAGGVRRAGQAATSAGAAAYAHAIAERSKARRARIAAGVWAFLVFVFLLVASDRDRVRCHQTCYGDAPLSSYGSLTYEPGHPWTRYAHSWQWDAQ